MIQKNSIGQIHHMWNPNEDAGFMAMVKMQVTRIVNRVRAALKKAA